MKDEKYKKYANILRDHLLITDFYCFESFYLFKKDIFPVIIEKSKTESLNEIRYYEGQRHYTDRIPSFTTFINQLTDYATSEINKLSKELFNVDLEEKQ